MTMQGGKDETNMAVPGERVRYVLGCSSTVNVPLCRNLRNSAAHESIDEVIQRVSRGCLSGFLVVSSPPAHISR